MAPRRRQNDDFLNGHDRGIRLGLKRQEIKAAIGGRTCQPAARLPFLLPWAVLLASAVCTQEGVQAHPGYNDLLACWGRQSSAKKGSTGVKIWKPDGDSITQLTTAWYPAVGSESSAAME